MTRAMVRLMLCGALVWLTAAVTVAQTSTTTETKKFQVIAVDGNRPGRQAAGRHEELTVPDDFRFNVDGKSCRCTTEARHGGHGDDHHEDHHAR